MSEFSVIHALSSLEDITQHPAYHAGNALGWLYRGNKQAATNHLLSGRLYLAKSGWLLLSVPNALVRGVYDAMSAPGAELPAAGLMNVPNVPADLLNAHISVMTADEVKKVGADNINERGHMFGYSLGSMTEITPKNVDGISKIWAIQVSSPALSSLRKSYGLTPLINDDHAFHITVAVRRKHILGNNSVGKCNETSAEPTEEQSFRNPTSRGELKAAAADGPQPRVRVVMPYKNQYLMETLNNSKWPQNIGKRRFMGGGIEKGETPEQAAAREMFEELGVKIKPTAFKPLGNDPREGWQHEHYLELLKHKLKPGNFNATVGSDAVVTLSHGLPEGDDYMGPDIKTLLAPAVKKYAADLLPGGEADNMADTQFPKQELAEGAAHEHEHTRNDQVAKEIAKDHLQEDPRYYEKVKVIEKDAQPEIVRRLLEAKDHSDNKRYDQKSAIIRQLMDEAVQDWVIDDPKPKYKGVTHVPTKFKFHVPPTTIPAGVKAATNSVYANQTLNAFNFNQPLQYDHNKPVFQNIRNQLLSAKQRGDFIMQTRRNHEMYMSALSPQYRHQRMLQAFRGELPQANAFDTAIENYGDQILNSFGGQQ